MEQYIRFKDGVELPCLGVHAQPITYEGIDRDQLIFLFDPMEVSVSRVAEEFTQDNCTSITIIQDGAEFVHNYYSILLGYGYANRNKVISAPMVTRSPDDTTSPDIVQEPEMVVFAKLIQTTMLERNVAIQGEVLGEVIEYMIATENDNGMARMSNRGLSDILEKLKTN